MTHSVTCLLRWPTVTKLVTEWAASTICAGCGTDLPTPRPTRGRPARFHNAACRQRARRARRAGSNGDLLAAIADLETATSELRRAVLTGADTAQAGRHLADASMTVAASLPGAPAAVLPTGAVTEPVTETLAEPPRHEARPPTPKRRRPARPRSVTEQVTKRKIVLGAVRVERNPDPAGRTWRVLAGESNDQLTHIGWVESARTISGTRNSRRWTITTTALLVVSNHARNRTDAVAALLDSYQRAGGVW